jgi:DNA (cytosine-5)-methyltransferase 1
MTNRAFAAADLCAAGFGAPHIRQRSFWVAHASDQRIRDQVRRGDGRTSSLAEREERQQRLWAHPGDALCIPVVRLDHSDGARHFRTIGDAEVDSWDEARLRLPSPGREDGGVAHMSGTGRRPGRSRINSADGDRTVRIGSQEPGRRDATGIGHNGAPSAHTFWSDADWLGCRDGKWRPVEPGTFPLAHGAANRVGRLRGYGNAIVGPVAQGFIEAVMAIEADPRIAV